MDTLLSRSITGIDVRLSAADREPSDRGRRTDQTVRLRLGHHPDALPGSVLVGHPALTARGRGKKCAPQLGDLRFQLPAGGQSSPPIARS